MANRQILVEILGSSKGYTAATEEATTATTKFQNVLTGIGQGIGSAGFALVGDAVSKVTEFLTGSLKAAQDSELSIAQLTTALKANAPAWDGNVTAIESYITQAEAASAFTKDDLRQSLESLVGATHDVTTAETLQTTATNLARYAHIDLATATTDVIKANEGVYKALTPLGIKINATTDSMTALADINHLVAGQDTSYIGSTAGQMQVLTNTIDDLQVELGEKLMPVFRTVLQFLNTVMGPDITIATSLWDNFLNVVTLGGSKSLEAYNRASAAMQHGMGTVAKQAAAGASDTLDQSLADQVKSISTAGAPLRQAIDLVSADVSGGWDALESQAYKTVTKNGKKFQQAVKGAYTTTLDLSPMIVPDSTRLTTLYKDIAKAEANLALALKKHDYVSVQTDEGNIAKLTSEINALIAADESSFGDSSGNTKGKAIGFATGGYVGPKPGGTQITVGEGGEGEYIVPKSKMGGGNVYITIAEGAFIDGFGIDRLVDKIALRMRLRGNN